MLLTKRQREIKNEINELQNKLREIKGKIEIKPESKKIKKEATKVVKEIDVLEKEFKKIEKSNKQLKRKSKLHRGKNMKLNIKSYNALPYNERVESFDNLSHTDKLATQEYKDAFWKAVWKGVNNLDEQELKFFQVGTNPVGNEDASPAVPTTTVNEIEKLLKDTGVLINQIKITYMMGDVKLPVQTGGSQAQWLSEGVADSGNITIGFVAFQKFEVVKNVEISRSTQFATIEAFESFVINDIVQEIGAKLDEAIANGDGVGKPTGLLQVPSIPTLTFTGGVTYDNLVTMWAILKKSYHAGAKWIMSLKTMAEIKKVKDADGNPIFIQAKDISTGSFGNIFGYDVIISDYYPALDDITSGDAFITIGNLSKYYWVNFNAPLTVETDDSTEFKKRLRVIQGCAILDGKITQAEAFVNAIKE